MSLLKNVEVIPIIYLMCVYLHAFHSYFEVKTKAAWKHISDFF